MGSSWEMRKFMTVSGEGVAEQNLTEILDSINQAGKWIEVGYIPPNHLFIWTQSDQVGFKLRLRGKQRTGKDIQILSWLTTWVMF